jgi:hypothetical protein
MLLKMVEISSKSKISFNQNFKSIIFIQKEERKAKMILQYRQMMNWDFFVFQFCLLL